MAKSTVVCLFMSALLFQFSSSIGSGTAFAQSGNPQSAINREVRHELIMMPRYSLFDWIEFKVQPDNSVVLSGQVIGFTLKADAEDAVKRVSGVTGVVNRIENLPPSSSDDQIRRGVYEAIYSQDSPLFHYAIEVVPTIHIIVKNGNVTLKGVVDSKSDSDLAYTRARTVSGILTLTNDLTVGKS